jgi:hypothetical protein
VGAVAGCCWVLPLLLAPLLLLPLLFDQSS